ncbi:MAG: hypothetical protein J3K34DRAFT_442060, partial [Monoraphidium minutum]
MHMRMRMHAQPPLRAAVGVGGTHEGYTWGAAGGTGYNRPPHKGRRCAELSSALVSWGAVHTRAREVPLTPLWWLARIHAHRRPRAGPGYWRRRPDASAGAPAQLRRRAAPVGATGRRGAGGGAGRGSCQGRGLARHFGPWGRNSRQWPATARGNSGACTRWGVRVGTLRGRAGRARGAARGGAGSGRRAAPSNGWVGPSPDAAQPPGAEPAWAGRAAQSHGPVPTGAAKRKGRGQIQQQGAAAHGLRAPTMHQPRARLACRLARALRPRRPGGEGVLRHAGAAPLRCARGPGAPPRATSAPVHPTSGGGNRSREWAIKWNRSKEID